MDSLSSLVETFAWTVFQDIDLWLLVLIGIMVAVLIFLILIFHDLRRWHGEEPNKPVSPVGNDGKGKKD